MREKIQQNSTNSTLTSKQLEVIQALAAGASTTDAAKRAGIDRTTIYFWRKNGGDFEAALALARREFADSQKARLRELAEDAVNTVRELMSSAEVSPGVRLRAALSVLQSVGAMAESPNDAVLLREWREDTDPLMQALESFPGGGSVEAEGRD
jgi:transposase